MSSGNQTVPPLQYACSDWRRSSQIASNIFDTGAKLWTKRDLRDIEQQLARSETCEIFTVRKIDGTMVSIKNPMFGEQFPIWQPRVNYQEYWRLIKAQPDGPSETYHCSYLVDWVNVSARRFRGVMENSNLAFEESRLAWKKSITCKLLRSQLEELLVARKVTKIVCFGLGDICRKPPEWWMRQMSSGGHDVEASFVRDSMIQHLIALTIAEVFHDSTGDQVQLLAQDPDYTDEAKEILEGNGFSFVGDFGAGGFAEVDDNSLVFSAFVEAPLKQIIADIARPVVIISTSFEVFNDSEKPWADAESPRTQDMWKEYDRMDFPVSPEDGDLVSKLHGLHFYNRKVVGHL